MTLIDFKKVKLVVVIGNVQIQKVIVGKMFWNIQGFTECSRLKIRFFYRGRNCNYGGIL